MTEAKALASAGDLAVPYLTNEGYKPVSIMTARIRALALIRTEFSDKST